MRFVSMKGMNFPKKLNTDRVWRCSSLYNPEAPFGLEPFGLELKVERKRRVHVLTLTKS